MNSVILHQNQKWYNFINTIKNKKDNICSCCKKKKELMLLDFNHYKIEKDPWEQEEKSAFLVCNSCFKNNENIKTGSKTGKLRYMYFARDFFLLFIKIPPPPNSRISEKC